MTETFEDAMAICREREFLQYEAFLSERLGVVLLELGQFEKAQYYVLTAVSLFKGQSVPAKVHAAERLLEALRMQTRTNLVDFSHTSTRSILGSQRKTGERIELRIPQSHGKVCLNHFSYYVLHHSERERRMTWIP